MAAYILINCAVAYWCIRMKFWPGYVLNIGIAILNAWFAWGSHG